MKSRYKYFLYPSYTLKKYFLKYLNLTLYSVSPHRNLFAFLIQINFKNAEGVFGKKFCS